MFELRPYRRNSINVWNPFSEMEEMEKRLFNNSFFLFFLNMSFFCSIIRCKFCFSSVVVADQEKQ